MSNDRAALALEMLLSARLNLQLLQNYVANRAEKERDEEEQTVIGEMLDLHDLDRVLNDQIAKLRRAGSLLSSCKEVAR